MKSASALGRRHVRLSAFVLSAVVVGLILSLSAGARTKLGSGSKPTAQVAPSLSSQGSHGSKGSMARPSVGAPHITLYDQYDNPGSFSTNAQNYENLFNTFDDELADDFVVPSGVGWSIDTVECG